jgi:hypothetical protein
MFGRSNPLPHIGTLRRGWGKWYGRLPVPALDTPLDLWIEVSRREPLEPFAELAGLFASRFGHIQAEFAGQLFEAYRDYRQMDLETPGGLTATDFAKHPSVTCAADIWQVLHAYRLRLGPVISRYLGNSYLLLNVDLPNPHFFQVFMEASVDGFWYTPTELVC